MSRERTTQRRISAWLHDEAPNQVPDRVLDATFERTRGTPQVSTVPGWRFLEMRSKPVAVAVGAAAIVVLLILGAAVLGRGGGATVGGPAPSPSPSAAACVKTIALKVPLADAGCRYSTTVFRPTVAVGGDPLWQASSETVRSLDFDLAGTTGDQAQGVGFVAIDRLLTKPCQSSTGGTLADAATVPFAPSAPGTGPADLFAWIARKTPLKVPTPSPVTIGGHPGLEATIVVPDGSLKSCGSVWITRPGDDSGADGGQWALAYEGWTWRVAFVDVNGTTVMVQSWAPPDQFATFLPEADKLIASTKFE